MILTVMYAIYAIAYLEAWKSQDFNRVWTRDLPILVQRSNQLSYEATVIGSWSFVGPREPPESPKLVKHGVIKKTNMSCWASPTVATKGW